MFIDTVGMDEQMEVRVRNLGSIGVAGLDISRKDLENAILRFANADYGDVSSEISWANDLAMYERRGRAWGRYTTQDGQKIIILTEFNQVVTQVSKVKDWPGEASNEL